MNLQARAPRRGPPVRVVEEDSSFIGDRGHVGDVSQITDAVVVRKPYGERPDDREPALRQASPRRSSQLPAFPRTMPSTSGRLPSAYPGALPHRIRVVGEAHALQVTCHSGQSSHGGGGALKRVAPQGESEFRVHPVARPQRHDHLVEFNSKKEFVRQVGTEGSPPPRPLCRVCAFRGGTNPPDDTPFCNSHERARVPSVWRRRVRPASSGIRVARTFRQDPS